MFAAVSVLTLKIPNGTSGSLARSSQPTNAASSAPAAAKSPIVSGEVQPKSLAWVIAKTSVTSPAVTSTAPSASNVLTCASRLSVSSSGVSARAASPTGTLM